MVSPLLRCFIWLPLFISLITLGIGHALAEVEAPHTYDKRGRGELRTVGAFELEPTLLPDARGRITILVSLNPLRSELFVRVRGLPATTRFNIFLTETTESRDLPARFLGIFTTDEGGRGVFSYTSGEDLLFATEFVEFDAKSSRALGVVDGKGDYSLDTPTELVELRAVRIYFASAEDASKAGAPAFDTPFSGSVRETAGEAVLGGIIEVSTEEP